MISPLSVYQNSLRVSVSFPSERYDEKTSVDQYTSWHCNKKVLIWEGERTAKQPCFAVRSPRSERNVSFLLPEKRLLLSISLTSQCSLTSCTTLLHFTQRSLVFSRFRRLSQTFGEKADTHYPAIHLCHCRRSPYICSRSPTLLKKPRPHTDQIGFLHPAVTLIWPHQQ